MRLYRGWCISQGPAGRPLLTSWLSPIWSWKCHSLLVSCYRQYLFLGHKCLVLAYFPRRSFKISSSMYKTGHCYLYAKLYLLAKPLCSLQVPLFYWDSLWICYWSIQMILSYRSSSPLYCWRSTHYGSTQAQEYCHQCTQIGIHRRTPILSKSYFEAWLFQ